jgi:hypothetical protein
MEKDISRVALEKAVVVLMQARGQVKKTLPYGPRKAGLDMKEARKRMGQDPSPSFIQNLVRQIGEEATTELLMGAHNG